MIFHLHKADAKHVTSVPVEEVYEGKTLWKGDVEVFDLTGHLRAKCAYSGPTASLKNNNDSGIAPGHRCTERG